MNSMPLQFSADTLTLVLLLGCWLVVCAWFVWVSGRSVTDMSPPRKRLALGVRLTLITLLFLSIAGARWVRSNDTLSVIFLMDASSSVRDDERSAARRFVEEALKTKRPTDTAAVISFAQDAHVKVAPDKNVAVGDLRHPGLRTATDIGQAMATALPLIPRNFAGKVVVLSDGNENVGSALAETPNLTARGVRVDSVALPSGLKREALIEKMVLPSRVKIGEPFSVKVITNGLNAQTGKLTLRRDGQPVAARTVDLPAGKRVHSFDVSIDKPGFYRFESSLDAGSGRDTLVENNQGLGFISVRGRPRVLYVSPNPSLMPYLRAALKGQNIDVDYAPPAAMPTTAAALQQFDSVILSDVPRGDLSQKQMEAVQISTRDFGVGFGMIGGQNSYGSGGWRNTPIEETLPVSLESKKQRRIPAVAVALVIDRSGSMEEGGPGQSKLDFAKEAAARAVQYLKPQDQIAVVTFTGDAEIQLPLTGLDRPEEIVGAIQQIGSGGGTSVYSGTKLGFDTVRKAPAPVKHIIVLTDGMSSDPDYGPMVAQMKREKITVTGVIIGAGTGAVNGGPLYGVSKETGGRFYMVDNPADVPGIYLQEMQNISAPPVVEEPFVPRQTEGDTVLSGIGGAPQLLGYNIVEAKPTASVSLISHRNDPVLATWRYGLGRSMAFTSDDRNRWAVHWLPWSGYGPFWAQAVRWTMRTFTPTDFQMDVTTEGTRGHVVVRAIDKEGRYLNRLNFRARVAGPDADPAQPTPEIPLRQTAPGTYEAWFDAAKIGTYLVNVTRDIPGRPPEMTVAGLVVPYSPEYRDLEANGFLLTQLAQAGGGVAATSPAQAFGGDRPRVTSPIELAHVLMLLVMLLFPADVAVRRLALEREDFRRGAAWVRARLRRVPAAPREDAATPELGRLKVAKGRAAVAGEEGREKREESGAAAPPRRPDNPAPDSQGERNTATQRPDDPTTQQPTPSVWARPEAPAAVRGPEPQAAAPLRNPHVSNTEVAPTPPNDPATQQPDDPTTSEAGMSRLMAAKRRAAERKKDE